MNARVQSGPIFLFLLVFAGVTLGINFAHTETGPVGRDDCPACHFLSSAQSANPAVAFLVPALLCQGSAITIESSLTYEADVLSVSSRAPPQV